MGIFGDSQYEKQRKDYHGRMLQEICNKLDIPHHELWMEVCKFYKHEGNK